jgi:hypothetical protein
LNIEFVPSFIAIVSLVNGCCLLVLQISAFRRYKHTSFRLLALSTVLALGSFLMMHVASATSISLSLRTATYWGGALLYVLYVVTALPGVVSLFRSYGALAKQVEDQQAFMTPLPNERFESDSRRAARASS